MLAHQVANVSRVGQERTIWLPMCRRRPGTTSTCFFTYTSHCVQTIRQNVGVTATTNTHVILIISSFGANLLLLLKGRLAVGAPGLRVLLLCVKWMRVHVCRVRAACVCLAALACAQIGGPTGDTEFSPYCLQSYVCRAHVAGVPTARKFVPLKTIKFCAENYSLFRPVCSLGASKLCAVTHTHR